jgi:hypothetical protein
MENVAASGLVHAAAIASQSNNPHPQRSASIVRILLATVLGLVILLAWMGLPFDLPFVGYGLASAFVFQIAVRPRRWEILAVILTACPLILFDCFVFRHGRLQDLQFSASLGMVGLVSFALLAFKAIWAEGEEQEQLKSILLPAAALCFFTLGSQRLLAIAGLFFRDTLDLYAYAFDGSLGFQPSFLIGRLFRDSALIGAIGHFTYFSIPIPMTLVYAAHLRKRNTPQLFMLEIFMASGLLGYFLYSAFPATGPAYVAGPSFPGSPLSLSALHHLNLRPIPMNWQLSRNAMPSLHMAWALLVWFNCKNFSRWVRALALGFVFLTIFDTLGTGEHYLIDLVVAFPFAVAMQALCTHWIPLRSPSRWVPLVGGMGIMATWLILLRYATAIFLTSPVIPWACLLATTLLASHWMKRVLSLEWIDASEPAELLHHAAAAGA